MTTAGGTEKDSHDAQKADVVEKRLKPTLIRRRAKAVESTAVPESPPTGEAASAAQGDAPPPQTEPAKPAAPRPAAPAASDKRAEQPAEKRIGLVGYINLGPAPVREEWKERQQTRAPKKRRSRDELEMESIMRTGGLKQFATLAEAVDEPSGEERTAPEVSAPIEQRVFQPGLSGRRRKPSRKDFKKTALTERKASKRVIRLEEGVTVAGLSQATGAKAAEILKRLMDMGVAATINTIIDVDAAGIIAQEFGYTVEGVGFKEEAVLEVASPERATEPQRPRPPVVTVMGHVDHGKTSLLDAIRKTSVAAGEAGGITQHIGAYEVATPSGWITFLDTPGHEAFTNMRARGAKVTDIVVLVVAADDGIMPQTVEAIHHAKAADVPIIVAINKIDKPGATPDRVKQALTEHELVPEEWGGEVICVPTSAKTGEGIDKLLEMILLQAEVMELTAIASGRAKGTVIEARLDRGRGAMATVIIGEGELKLGDIVVCGRASGRIRAMFDADGAPQKTALPSKPVEILGLSSVPEAGDELVAVADDEQARQIVESRQKKERARSLAGSVRSTLEDLQSAPAETKDFPVLIKADAFGSQEAVAASLEKLSTDKVKIKVIHKGVGAITESDCMLASTVNAAIVGFNIQPDAKAKEAAERFGVPIRIYRIIYEMIEDVRKAMEGVLAPEEVERVLGRAEIREVFRISKLGQIAGCTVVAGKIQRNASARLLRDQVIVYEGKIVSLRRFKDDAREVAEGFECGIGLENFQDVKVGDVIEAFVMEKKAATL